MKSILEQIKRDFSLPEMEVGTPFTVIINKKSLDTTTTHCSSPNLIEMQIDSKYTISVKKYMNEPSTVSFDFMEKFNNNIPMPLSIMTGEVLKETRGMYYMKLHGKAEPSVKCICCGRTLKNKVSMLYGIGPECGRHFNINPFETEEELNEHFQELKEMISNITWEGWVIKKAIKEYEKVD